MSQEKDQSSLTEIEQLRQLLVGRETAVIQSLRERLDDPSLRANDLADVLVQAIRISENNGDNLAAALEKPVQATIKQSIERDTQFFADALFPVMGPAIRKSINESLKALVQSINSAVENSFSPQSLRWRMEARRTGVSFGEVVLRHTLVYRVEQVLLVQRDSGLLVQHVERPEIQAKDGDAVSAMLTAIQDFVRDSFTPEGEQAGDLGSVSVGEQNVWLINSPQLTMACVIRGLAPESLRVKLQEILEDILRVHGGLIGEFDGDRARMEPLLSELERCFGYVQTVKQKEEALEGEFTELDDSADELKKTSTGQRLLKWLKSPVFYMALAVLSIVAWHFWVHASERQQRQQLLDALSQAPGVLVTKTQWERINEWGFWGRIRPERKLLVEGLEDPAASQSNKLAEQLGYAPERIRIRMQPYHSLDHDIQQQRVQDYFSPPSTVKLELVNGKVLGSGIAKPEWLSQWQGHSMSLPGIHGVDLNAVQLDLSAQIAAQKKALAALMQSVNGSSLYFSRRMTLNEQAQTDLDRIAQQLNDLNRQAHDLHVPYVILLKPYSDGLGVETLNQPMRMARAEVVKTELLARQVPEELIRIDDGGVAGEAGKADLTARKVELYLIEGIAP